jgi:hypothetical protein
MKVLDELMYCVCTVSSVGIVETHVFDDVFLARCFEKVSKQEGYLAYLWPL